MMAEDFIDTDVERNAVEREVSGGMLLVEDEAVDIAGGLVFKEGRRERVEGTIACREILFGVHIVFDRKGGETEASFLTNGIEDVCRTGVRARQIHLPDHLVWLQ